MMLRLPVVLAGLLGALLIAESWYAPRSASPDAYQYLDVAVNLAAGHGLVQSVPGYNSPRFPPEPTWPAPFTAQPPGYPGIGALAVRAGVEPTIALCVLASAGFVLTWFIGAALAAAVWGADAGLLSLCGLALSAASGTLTNRIWSDPLAIACSFASLLALRRAGTGGAGAVRWSLLSGALAGGACLMRYVLGLLMPFGALWLVAARSGAERWRLAAVHGGTGMLLTLPVLLRNRALTGGWFGEPRNPSTQDLYGFVTHAMRMTWGRVPGAVQLTIACVLLGLVYVGWKSREQRRRAFQALSEDGGLLILWGLTYAVVLLVLRLRIHFDAVGVRLLAPTLVAGALALTGVVVRWLSPPRPLVVGAVSLMLLLSSVVVARRVATAVVATPPGARSEFLDWLAAEAPPGAVVLAENAVDLAWELRHEPGMPRRFLSFSTAPYMRPLETDDLRRLAARTVRPGGPPLRLIVRGEAADSNEWRALYGELIANAVAGRVPAGEGLVLEQVVSGRHVLRWQEATGPTP
ncbi:MAG: hypothetical protein ABL977_03600 [Candidatus Eisenbacteria bacterium]